MDYQAIWDRIFHLTANARNVKKALIQMLEDEYGSFDTAARLLSNYIIKTGFCARVGRYNLIFLEHKSEDYKLNVANNLIYWALNCYPLVEWYGMAWDKIHAEILRAYDCLCSHIRGKYGINDCPKLKFKKVWISTSVTYPGVKGRSRINIGILGVLSESKHRSFTEYSNVAKVIFNNPVKERKTYDIKLNPDEYYLAGVLTLAHEMSHFVSSTLEPHRRTEGRRFTIHGAEFLKVYRELLEYLSCRCYPELKKYLNQKE